MGPRAGEQGGNVVFAGPLAEMLREGNGSMTGDYLAGRKAIPVPKDRRVSNGRAIRVEGAREHNLKEIDLTIPLNMLVCVTGVSGSGKSTLVHNVLYKGLRRALGEQSAHPGAYRTLDGYEHVSGVEMVDQTPIGRSPRSNPVTYIQVFDQIRHLFAATQAARIRGYSPGTFSFNVPGGRCEECEGDGVVKVEMQFPRRSVPDMRCMQGEEIQEGSPRCPLPRKKHRRCPRHDRDRSNCLLPGGCGREEGGAKAEGAGRGRARVSSPGAIGDFPVGRRSAAHQVGKHISACRRPTGTFSSSSTSRRRVFILMTSRNCSAVSVP